MTSCHFRIRIDQVQKLLLVWHWLPLCKLPEPLLPLFDLVLGLLSQGVQHDPIIFIRAHIDKVLNLVVIQILVWLAWFRLFRGYTRADRRLIWELLEAFALRLWKKFGGEGLDIVVLRLTHSVLKVCYIPWAQREWVKVLFNSDPRLRLPLSEEFCAIIRNIIDKFGRSWENTLNRALIFDADIATQSPIIDKFFGPLKHYQRLSVDALIDDGGWLVILRILTFLSLLFASCLWAIFLIEA